MIEDGDYTIQRPAYGPNRVTQCGKVLVDQIDTEGSILTEIF